MSRSRIIGKSVALAAVAGTALALVPAGLAKDGDVRVVGTCTKASSAKLKLSEEDGRIEVEFEVDQNRNGIVWNVALKHNGARFFKGTRSTKAPSGSFSVRRVVDDAAGADRIAARATSPSGEVCTASASF